MADLPAAKTVSFRKFEMKTKDMLGSFGKCGSGEFVLQSRVAGGGKEPGSIFSAAFELSLTLCFHFSMGVVRPLAFPASIEPAYSASRGEAGLSCFGYCEVDYAI